MAAAQEDVEMVERKHRKKNTSQENEGKGNRIPLERNTEKKKI